MFFCLACFLFITLFLFTTLFRSSYIIQPLCCFFISTKSFKLKLVSNSLNTIPTIIGFFFELFRLVLFIRMIFFDIDQLIYDGLNADQAARFDANFQAIVNEWAAKNPGVVKDEADAADLSKVPAVHPDGRFHDRAVFLKGIDPFDKSCRILLEVTV